MRIATGPAARCNPRLFLPIGRRTDDPGSYRGTTITGKAREAGRAVLVEQAKARTADLADIVKKLQADGWRAIPGPFLRVRRISTAVCLAATKSNRPFPARAGNEHLGTADRAWR